MRRFSVKPQKSLKHASLRAGDRVVDDGATLTVLRFDNLRGEYVCRNDETGAIPAPNVDELDGRIASGEVEVIRVCETV